MFVHFGDEVISLLVNPAETVLSVKFKLAKKKKFPVHQQVLMYEGQFLKNDKTLAEYDIVNTASLSLVLSSNPGQCHIICFRKYKIRYLFLEYLVV